MPSPAEVAARVRTRDSIVDLAMRDLVAVWRTLTLDDVAKARSEIEAVLPLIIDGYGTPIAALSADWYDELREQARLTQAYRAIPAATPGAAEISSLAGWSTGALYGASPQQEAALSALTGGLQRLITNMDRDTTLLNVASDPTRVRYARHASANACAFCALVATRGAVYLSEKSATRVVGRGTEKRHDGSRRDTLRKGIKPRGNQSLDDKYHDHCHCTSVAVFEGETYEEPSYVANFRDAYAEAPAPPNSGALDLKDTLSSMRKTLGAK